MVVPAIANVGEAVPCTKDGVTAGGVESYGSRVLIQANHVGTDRALQSMCEPGEVRSICRSDRIKLLWWVAMHPELS